MITHYQRLLDLIQPCFVHIMVRHIAKNELLHLRLSLSAHSAQLVPSVSYKLMNVLLLHLFLHHYKSLLIKYL
jgi:Fe-S cluster assembly ATPase SufC